MEPNRDLGVRLVAYVLSFVVVAFVTVAVCIGPLFIPAEYLGVPGTWLALFLFFFGACLTGALVVPVARWIETHLHARRKRTNSRVLKDPDPLP